MREEKLEEKNGPRIKLSTRVCLLLIGARTGEPGTKKSAPRDPFWGRPRGHRLPSLSVARAELTNLRHCGRRKSDSDSYSADMGSGLSVTKRLFTSTRRTCDSISFEGGPCRQARRRIEECLGPITNGMAGQGGSRAHGE